jgi:hypothetical protein
MGCGEVLRAGHNPTLPGWVWHGGGKMQAMLRPCLAPRGKQSTALTFLFFRLHQNPGVSAEFTLSSRTGGTMVGFLGFSLHPTEEVFSA